MPNEFTLSDQHKLIVEFSRSHLESLEVDTLRLDDHAMMISLLVIMETMRNKDMAGGLHQALAEYGDRFLDLGTLAGEMIACEGRYLFVYTWVMHAQ